MSYQIDQQFTDACDEVRSGHCTSTEYCSRARQHFLKFLNLEKNLNAVLQQNKI